MTTSVNKLLMFLMLYKEITDGVQKRQSEGDSIAVVFF